MLFVVGPSHVPRWRHVVNGLGYPRPARDVTFVGDGGYPIWHKSSFDRVRRDFKEGDKVYLIVGDFRFGNRRVRDWPFSQSEIFKDGYTHVERELIGALSDQRMKSLCLAALAEWRRVFGDDLFILQWTLAMQAIQCRVEKRYLDTNGVLAHPSWNIVEMTLLANDVQGIWRFADPDAVKFKSLFIDRDLHPSALGYLYLTEIYRTRDHEKAFWAAYRSYRVAFDRIFNAFEGVEPRRRLLTGDSFAIKVMDRMIPLEFRRRFEELGLRMVFSQDEIALDVANGKQPFDELIYVSQATLGDAPTAAATQWSRTREKFKAVAHNVSILPWEAIFEQLVVRRGKYVTKERIPLALDVLDALKGAVDLDYTELLECGGANGLIEHGAGGAPTLDGVFFILSVAVGGKKPFVRPFGS